MKNRLLVIAILAGCLLVILQLPAQVAINTNGSFPNNSAMLDVSATDRGLLLPRMTQEQISLILNPADGLIVFCTTDHKFYVYTINTNLWREIDFGNGTIEPPFICGNPFTDSRDQKVYNTVLIGAQCWFAQNLNVGTRINSQTAQSDNGIIEKYCYDDLESNCDMYGGIYQWNEAMQFSTTPGVQGICPAGWHLPTDAEWTTLTTFLGGENIAGGKMKEAGVAHWLTPNIGATNSSGFTVLPAGDRNGNGYFYDVKRFAGFWSSSQTDAADAWCRSLLYSDVVVNLNNGNVTNGFSARCLHD
jgi:uncharacterized protein (TIGR02145 family)